MFTTINQRIKAVLDTVYGGNVTAIDYVLGKANRPG